MIIVPALSFALFTQRDVISAHPLFAILLIVSALAAGILIGWWIERSDARAGT